MPRKVLPRSLPTWTCIQDAPWIFTTPVPAWFTAGVWLRYREALQQAGFSLIPVENTFDLQFTVDFIFEVDAAKKRDEIFTKILLV